jgi:hypothetical protein
MNGSMTDMRLMHANNERQPKAIALCEADARAPWREIF